MLFYKRELKEHKEHETDWRLSIKLALLLNVLNQTKYKDLCSQKAKDKAKEKAKEKKRKDSVEAKSFSSKKQCSDNNQGGSSKKNNTGKGNNFGKSSQGVVSSARQQGRAGGNSKQLRSATLPKSLLCCECC